MKKKTIILSIVLAIVLAMSSIPVFHADNLIEKEGERGINIDPVNITPSSITICKGQSYQLSVALGQDYTGAEVTWHSSDTSVATVGDGLVTGLRSGTATIYASINYAVPEGQLNYDTCQVTVGSTGIIANGTYFIKNVNAGKFIDVEGPSTADGTKMQLWELTGDTQRKWTVSLGTDGYYRIKSYYSNKYMRVTGSSATAGATITQYSSIVSGSKWSFMITSAGNYAIIPACIGTTLVVLNAPGTTNGYDLNTAVYTKNSDYKDEWKVLSPEDSELSIYTGYKVSTRTFTIQCVGTLATGTTWYPLIQSSVSAWNSSGAGTNITAATTSSSYMCSVDSYTATWYGRTSFSSSNPVISSALIEINSNACSSNSSFRKSVITHEIGHLLGLADDPAVSSANMSLMHHNRDRTVIFEPQSFDILNVVYIYS